MTMRRLLLWDIDGTLIRGDGVGTTAMYQAAATVCGKSPAAQDVSMGGKTDPQILTEIFVASEIAHADIPALLPDTIAEYERLYAAAEADLRARGYVIDGAVDALHALSAFPDVRQTLLTGNLVANAMLKLDAFDLSGFFDVEVGAYGTDHADRRELVPIALERVERLRGERYAPHEVWVIGDTPNDYTCAAAAGVRCALVATGKTEYAELSTLGADATFADLCDLAPFVELVTT